ncbi:hypothetical protein RRG08_028482 [Elysia crispata]|uniref:Ninjurin-1 n=1 Tax=Elysia crispata TaxID=231223 RepID=A0AAE1AUL0_9GAST|nr:hypothetical protein RRG08_028482 [Elysia crispata]
MRGDSASVDPSGTSPSLEIQHQHSNQDIIELRTVRPKEDSKMAIVAATDASKIPLPSPETEGSRPPTPVVVQLELAERQHSSSTKTSEEALAQERVDLAPVAMDSLTSNNQFTARKMASQGLIDVALMMANISQLRTLITAGSEIDNFALLLFLVIFSLVAQIIFAVIIFIIYIRESEDFQKEMFMAALREGDVGTTSEAEAAKAFKQRMKQRFQRHQLTNRLNFITIVLVFVITVINMFITGFGIKLGENGLDASLIDTFDVASTTATFSADVDNVTAGPFGLDVDVMDLSFSVYSNRSEAG